MYVFELRKSPCLIIFASCSYVDSNIEERKKTLIELDLNKLFKFANWEEEPAEKFLNPYKQSWETVRSE